MLDCIVNVLTTQRQMRMKRVTTFLDIHTQIIWMSKSFVVGENLLQLV